MDALDTQPPTVGVGEEMYRLVRELYPVCRSITGDGVRATLRTLAQRIPLAIEEVPSGTQVFDWTVPPEWNIRDAYVKDARGKKVIDFQSSNLHVVGYSIPVRRRVSLAELREHLFTLPEQPDLIPYRTSYYRADWGFCVDHRTFQQLDCDEYEVVIDSSLSAGSLTYGECFIAGETPDEVLISTHICHPSLCNDNLSGIALATFLADHMRRRVLRYSYRFLFIPGTIGSIAWLCRNEQRTPRIKHGLVLANVGDPGQVTYKRSRRGDAEVDRVAVHVLARAGSSHAILDFAPYGYDERQFCSPGFDLPIGCFMRTPHGQFPEYHTSADDLSLVQPGYLGDSYEKCLSILNILDQNRRYVSQHPKCEPQLGKRGLYGAVGGQRDGRARELALLWVLNLSDGRHSLLDIAGRSGLEFDAVWIAAQALLQHGLLKEDPVDPGGPDK